MPPHVALWNEDGTPASDIVAELTAGTSSAVFVREIYNDKNNTFADTSDARGIRARLLVSNVIGYVDDEPVYGPWRAYGSPVADERWFRWKTTAFLNADGSESTEGVTGTLPFGTNSEIPILDLAPQEGVRIELQIIVPGGQTLDATKIKLSLPGNLASSPLSQFATGATGAGVIPADRIAGLRSLLRGSEVTANDTATVTLARGQLVYDGTEVTFPQTTQTFNLNDSAGIALLAGESYRVTLSRNAAGVVTATKGPKNEALVYPAKPAANIFVANLTVTSADGAAVTVSQASVIQTAVKYAQFLVRAGVGLAARISRGDGVTGSDLRQYLSHDTEVALVASSTNRVWRIGVGSFVVTQTDTEPEFGADLLALIPTSAGAVSDVIEARKFAHRAVTEWPLRLTYRAALSQVAVPALALDLGILDFDGELEAVTFDLTAKDGTWTGGTLKVDVRHFAPGVAVPFPVGGAGAGGASIYTSSGTDDRRPSIAWNAASLRVVVVDHEVRRFLAGTRFVIDLVTTVAAPGAEPAQEIRVTLHFRRYR